MGMKQTTKTQKEYDEFKTIPVLPGEAKEEREERLSTDEKFRKKLATIKLHLEFWNDVEVIIVELVKEQEKIEFRSAEQRRAINTSVYTKVNAMFENQTAQKLEALKRSISSQ